MKGREVTVVRIYLTEGDHLLKRLLEYLHDHEAVMGVTVFRGTAGFGRSGKVHGQGLLDVSFDLPLVVEFFDTPPRVDAVLGQIGDWLEPGHIVSWGAVTNA